jgi:lysophospholipase L1-like esterase
MEIGIWGDSITYGECDIDGLGWVGRLRKKMLDTAGVYNRGVCGDTTKDLLKRFSVEADSIEPNEIIFAIGINDSKFPSGKDINNVPFEEFKDNLRELLKQAQKYTSKVSFIGLTRVSEERRSPARSKFINTEIQRYDNFVKELAKSEGVVYVSTKECLDTNIDLADGLHPNAQGYDKLFNLISPFITHEA